MRDQHQRRAVLAGLRDQRVHHFGGGGRVEVASGFVGQLQRVAIARALVHRPSLLLADEPTGNLDPSTAAKVMDALIAQTREHGASLVLVTHSEAAAGRADRVLHLSAEGISTLTIREYLAMRSLYNL